MAVRPSGPSRAWATRPAALAGLLASALALAACGGGGGGGATPPAQVPSLTNADLHRCKSGPTPRSFRCGEIWVPFEREDPSLGKTRIGFAVVPHSDRSQPGLGAIFAVEGGPGYASSWTVRSYVKLFGSLLDRRDLVLVDQRGTGRSVPLQCPDLQFGRAPDWIAFPACASKLGPRFSSYRTSASADDIDDVRRALGFDRITLYGDSYGTFLAQSYAFRHPDTLNALVLDSAYPVMGESAWYPSLITTGVRSMVIACRRSPECHGNARRRLGKLVVWLRARHRGVGALVDALAVAGNSPPESYLQIDRAGTALRHGDATPYKRLIAEAKLGYGHIRHFNLTQEDVVSCNDYPLLWNKDASEAERRAELERKVRDYRNAAAFAPFKPREVALSSETLYQYCLEAPRPSSLYEPPVAPGEQPTKAPVLIVSGELDDVTTPYEGRLVAKEFPDSRQFVARGAGHVADLYDGSSPPAVRTRRFLRQALDHNG
ncbi:MAG: alpha/beta fold hydrolase [Solirubrobacterales bacterium]